jgi:NAD(P)-dependent dehydrogenase (short-subunit alcohol dehydrogenase family)
LTADAGQHGLDGRRCLVTGDDSPLRAAICAGLEQAGAAVAAVPGATTASAVADALAAARGELGGIDALVACPRLPAAASVDELDPEGFDTAFDLACKSPFLYTQAVLPDLRQHGDGRLVYVTSAAGVLGRAYTAHVAAAARAVIALARTVALEEAPRMTANVVAVGPMDGDPLLAARSRALAAAEGVDRDAAIAAVRERIPLGRLTEPADVVQAVSWALRPESGFLTGQVVAVAGGSELQVWP